MEQGRDLIALLALDDRGTQMCANRSRYANTPLLLRQVDMALALGCETLILLARRPDDSDVMAAQHLAEANGMRFHLLTRPQQLPALVTDSAELILFSPGALATDGGALHDLLGSPGLLTIPAESAGSKDLERLDMHTVWGGALRMSGDMVVQIDPLGNECELLSALPRIARSSGVAERPVPAKSVAGGAWSPGPVGAFLPAAKPARQTVFAGITGPLSQALAKKNLPVYLPFGAAFGLIMLAAVFLWLEHPAVVIALLAAAMLAVQLQWTVNAEADPLRLSGRGGPEWAGVFAAFPEALAATTLGLVLASETSVVPAIYAAAALLGASWLSRRSTVAGYEGVTSGPLLWLLIAGLGALGLWWSAVALGTAAAFAAIALDLRILRRITRP